MSVTLTDIGEIPFSAARFRFIRDHVLPKYYTYRYWSVYTSKKFGGGWVVTLWKEDYTVNMNYVRGLDPLEGEEAYEDDEEEL
jgi:hypothetical protein